LLFACVVVSGGGGVAEADVSGSGVGVVTVPTPTQATTTSAAPEPTNAGTVTTPTPEPDTSASATPPPPDTTTQANNNPPAPAPGPSPLPQPNYNWQPPGPAPTPTPSKSAEPVDPNAFSESAARSALAGPNGVVAFCKKADGPTGPGSATITFNPDGSVASVAMDPPYAGTPTGDCIKGQLQRAKTKSFQGSPQSVKDSFTIPK
jgi:hypothetical protein